MRLAVLVDVIAIAAGIAIILPAVDGRAEHAAEDRAGNRAFAGADARDDRAGDRAADRADRGTGCDIAPVLAVVRNSRCCNSRCCNSRCCNLGIVAVLVRIGRAAGTPQRWRRGLRQVQTSSSFSSLLNSPPVSRISAFKRHFVPASIICAFRSATNARARLWSFRDTALERDQERNRECATARPNRKPTSPC